MQFDCIVTSRAILCNLCHNFSWYANRRHSTWASERIIQKCITYLSDECSVHQRRKRVSCQSYHCRQSNQGDIHAQFICLEYLADKTNKKIVRLKSFKVYTENNLKLLMWRKITHLKLSDKLQVEFLLFVLESAGSGSLPVSEPSPILMILGCFCSTGFVKKWVSFTVFDVHFLLLLCLLLVIFLSKRLLDIALQTRWFRCWLETTKPRGDWHLDGVRFFKATGRISRRTGWTLQPLSTEFSISQVYTTIINHCPMLK